MNECMSSLVDRTNSQATFCAFARTFYGNGLHTNTDAESESAASSSTLSMDDASSMFQSSSACDCARSSVSSLLAANASAKSTRQSGGFATASDDEIDDEAEGGGLFDVTVAFPLDRIPGAKETVIAALTTEPTTLQKVVRAIAARAPSPVSRAHVSLELTTADARRPHRHFAGSSDAGWFSQFGLSLFACAPLVRQAAVLDAQW